jgi:hypothetical protein
MVNQRLGNACQLVLHLLALLCASHVTRACLMTKRQCGSCSLCCKVLDVPEVFSPAGHWCKHFQAGAGCDIHQLRPKTCREFSCVWLAEDWLDDSWQPSVAKFVLIWEYEGRCLSIIPDTKMLNSWKAEPYYEVFKQLAARHLSENRIIMVVEPTRRILVLPDQEIVVGARSEKFDWTITSRMLPSGMSYDVDFTPVETDKYAAKAAALAQRNMEKAAPAPFSIMNP